VIRARRFVSCLVLAAISSSLSLSGQSQLTLPRQPGSVRFAAIGDMGTGKMPQYELAARMETLRKTFPFHGSAVELRQVLEPLFLEYGVQVVFAGHEHVYERVKPQKGITYFIEGAAGELRKGNLTKGTTLIASGYDQDLSFVLVEIVADAMSFQTISRLGTTVDSGVILYKASSRPETK